jgi:hypothetical protein
MDVKILICGESTDAKNLKVIACATVYSTMSCSYIGPSGWITAFFSGKSIETNTFCVANSH